MMRSISLAVLVLMPVLAVAPAFGQAHVPVEGYRRDDGTYVPRHHRTAPDDDFWNNWSTYPNVNPYTGELGTLRQPPNRRADAFSDSRSPGVWGNLDARPMLRQKQAQRAAARSRLISQINAMRSRAAEMRAAAPLMRAQQDLLDRQLELERRHLELQERQLRAEEEALRMERARQAAWERRVQNLLRNAPAPPPARIPDVRPAQPPQKPDPPPEPAAHAPEDKPPADGSTHEPDTPSPKRPQMSKAERWLSLARNYELNGRLNWAIGYYKHVIRTYPASAAADRARKRLGELQ